MGTIQERKEEEMSKKYILVSPSGLYFKEMTGIGPCSTDDIKEAAKFKSKAEAAESPAMRHLLACYDVEELQ